MKKDEEPRQGDFPIRPIVPADTPALVALSCSSGLFKPEELGAIQEMLDDYYAKIERNRKEHEEWFNEWYKENQPFSETSLARS